MAVDWGGDEDGQLTHTSPILVVCHGLTGCSLGMRSFCQRALRRGFRPVVFNKRGHGGVALATPKMQAFGDISDIDQVIESIHAQYPDAVKVGAGFSAGSGLLVSYLGEKGTASRLAAGVAISPGYDISKLFTTENEIDPMYNSLMTYSTKKLLIQHESTLTQHADIDFSEMRQSSTIQEVDELVYMKCNGFEDVEKYWEHNNPMKNIQNVAVPVLCINALDDPICTKGMIPYDLLDAHPTMMLITTETGGHCGFYEQSQYASSLSSWAEKVAVEYLQAALSFPQHAHVQPSTNPVMT